MLRPDPQRTFERSQMEEPNHVNVVSSFI